MRTIKSTILDFLSDGKYKDKEEICSAVGYYAGCYSETVGRKLRELQQTGKIEKLQVSGKRGTKYRLNSNYGLDNIKAFTPKQHIEECHPSLFSKAFFGGKPPEPDFTFLRN